MLIGDLIVAVNGQPVASVDDLAAQLPSELIGTQIPLTVVRGATSQQIRVIVGERA